ncbi:hypothetical protein [Microbispora bryophytorum]|uniref:hypothetical protein n=1 Tax=Microbispora bryophytorum TaxID=1460882 RepID=UPI00371BB645
MLFLAPTPSPIPTVTVTQTVVVPTSFPTPIIRVVAPADDFSWLKDFFLGNFGGALLGVLGAMLATWFVIKSDRGGRDEEYRRNLALEFADATHQLAKELVSPDLTPSLLDEKLHRFVASYARVHSLYSGHRVHGSFATWLTYLAGPISPELQPLKWALRNPPEPAQAAELIQLINKTRVDLEVIEATTLEWLKSPKTWEPDLSAREAHERVLETLRSRSESAN